MPKGTNQKLKLYRLAQIMLENTDDEHYITMPEIMEELVKPGDIVGLWLPRGAPLLLMQAAIAASTEALHDAQNDVVIAGEHNLLAVSDFAQDMSQLRRAFDLFEQKTLLMRLLDESSQAAGVRIYIGGENQAMPVDELSVVSAPYAVNGQIVGTLGVIGPTRMPYQRMIEIVDITSRMIGNALSLR